MFENEMWVMKFLKNIFFSVLIFLPICSWALYWYGTSRQSESIDSIEDVEYHLSQDMKRFLSDFRFEYNPRLSLRGKMYYAVGHGSLFIMRCFKYTKDFVPFRIPFVNPVYDEEEAKRVVDEVEESLKGSPEKFAYLLKIYAKDPYCDGTQWYFYGGVLKYIKEKYARYKKYLPSGERYREVAFEFGMSHLDDMGEFIDEPLEFQKELFKRRVMKLYGSDFKEGYTEYRGADVFGVYSPEIYQNGRWRMKEVMHFGARTVKNRCLSGSEPFEVEYENPAYDWNKAMKILDDFEKKYSGYWGEISDIYYNAFRDNEFDDSDLYTKTKFCGKLIDELKKRRKKYWELCKAEIAKAKADNGDESENGRK